MNYPNATDTAAVFGIAWTIVAVTLGIELILFAAVYVLNGIGFMKLYRKVGVEPWAAWVPFFNSWRLLEAGGQPGWISLLVLVPIGGWVTAVFQAISAYKIGTAMRKEGAWVVLYIFLSFVWAWILGDDPTPYDPSVMAERGWTRPLAGYGSVAGPYVPTPPAPPAA